MSTTIRKWLSGALALALLVAAPGSLFAQTSYYYWWQAIDEYGQAYTGQNVQCSVYRPQFHGAASLHSTSTLAGYTASNDPLWSDTTGKLHFYSGLDTTFDVVCAYTYGSQQFSGRMDRFSHKVVLPRAGASVARFAVNSTAATYQTSSGVTLPAGSIIRDVIIQNLAPQGLGTYHLSVGFLGNHAVATAIALVQTQALTSPDEWLRPHAVGGFGTGLGGGTLTGNHRGTALSDYHTSLCLGGVCGSTAAGISRYVERSYLVHVATGLTVSYSAQPGTAAAVRAHVWILYDRLHTSANTVPFGAGR